MMDSFSITIKKIVEEANQVKTFVFEPDKPFLYKAGQFITLLHNTGLADIRRNYSFSSAPIENEYAISLKRIPNGEFSRWMHDRLKPGDKIEAIGPSGIFVVNEKIVDRESQLILIAAGSGITPVYSIIKEILASRPGLRMLLIYSNSSPEQAIFRKALEQLQLKYPEQLSIEWLFSNNQDLLRARLSKLVLKHIIDQKKISDWNNVYAYTCGPFDYMRMTKIVLLNEGLPAANFRMEQFVDFGPVPVQRRHYDNTDRKIAVTYQHQTHELMVPWKISILDAAIAAGINLPYSCHAGRCSTCRCKILSGTMWMHYNEVLTDEDETNGWGLTCTGHPSSDQLHITLDF